MARTRWPPGPVNPGLFPGQADQTGSAGGCLKTWGPADRSISRQPERRRPIRRSGRDPGLRPYARTRPKPPKQGRKHNPHPPCRFRAALGRLGGLPCLPADGIAGPQTWNHLVNGYLAAPAPSTAAQDVPGSARRLDRRFTGPWAGGARRFRRGAGRRPGGGPACRSRGPTPRVRDEFRRGRICWALTAE